MKYTKLFNQHSEYVAYTGSTAFIRPNVSWCIQESEAHCTPKNEQCSERHEYALDGEPSYPSSVAASATSFELSFDYIDSYTAITCEEGTIESSETVSIEIDENLSIEPRTVSGVYIFNGISIPYSLTQEGAEITVEDPVISCDGLEITITCATPMADIYYKLTDIGSYSAYTSAIAITADTDAWCYATLSGVTSNVVTATCEYNPTHDYSKDYLTFNVLSDGVIRWMSKGSNMAKTISYSINDGNWTEITATSAGVTINVKQGDKVRFKGTNSTYASDKSNYSGFDSSGLTNAAQFNIEGNIMSLVYGDNFSGETAMTRTYNFCSIFKASKVVSAENLILPSTTLTQYCYRAMFSWCESLIKAPQLPATTLAQGCYWYMFEQCALTTAPDLLAETLVAECYGHMFEYCNSLNYIKALATSGFGSSKCKEGWTKGVASNGTFIKNQDVTIDTWTRGDSGIPTKWIVEDESTVKSPTISFDGFSVITLSCETEGADIFYKLNNTGNYSAYTTAIVINEDTFIETYAELNSESSITTSQTCVYVSDIPIEYSNRDLKKWQYNGNEIATPYSVNAIDGHSSSYAKGTFNFETSFALRKAEPTYLWFQHADQSAEIFVDGVSVGKHWGGYAAFTMDISNSVHSGINNIKVALKNNEGNNLAPASGDFNLNATLGNVRLLTSPYVPAMNYGYDGFHITSTVSDAEATINIKTSVPTGATLVCKIDDDNTNIYSATSASTGEEMTFTKVITNPHLWDGTLDPHMYTVTLEIYKGNDIYHRFVRPYGLRYYEYVINDTEKVGTSESPYTGFLLNGHKYLLRGCCMHDDIAGKANALDETDYDTTFATIQELGLNFLRLAHYPHPKEVYDRCDTLGIIVETEAPCVNKLQSTMPSAYYEHLTGQYTDMVNQHYNHPCIFFWGLSNETTTDDKAFAKTKIEGYTSLIKSLDSERMVGYVLAQSPGNDPSTYYNNPNVDWFGCNIYVGWYDSPNSNTPTSQINTRLNNTINKVGKPMAYSEYGCGGTQRCHSDDFMNTTTRGNNPRHDIEYMMWLHEGHIATIKQYPQLMFTSQWQLFDIAVSNRNEGYTVCLDGVNASTDDSLRRLNNKGLVERDHVTKKDTFYLYKAWWNTADTFVHICGKNYKKIDDRVIKCYTNVTGTLTMYINGTSAATATVSNYIAEFAVRDFTSGDVVSVSGSNVGDSFTISGITNKHDYVEIGGIKWATMNIGANRVTDEGLHFQWGDTSGYTADQVGSGSGKKYFSWPDYKYADTTTTPTAITKYNATDGKTELDPSDDAATVIWGNSWRMPTADEFATLKNSINSAWTNDYQGSGVSGVVCTDKTDSTKVLFFPKTGFYENGIISNSSTGVYSSKTLSPNGEGNSLGVTFSKTEAVHQMFNRRDMGCAIRPVKTPYDAEIEYLENSGTTYIDTGIIPDSDTGIYVKTSSGYSSLYQTEDVFIVGLRNNGSDTRWIVGHNERGFYYGYGVYDSTSYVATNADSECKLNYLNNKKWIVNDVEKTTLPSTLSFVPAYNIRLFGSAGYSAQTAYYRSCKAKIYFVKISQGSNVIMDLIPVRKDGVGYMYDKISGTLYGKSGDGELILGPDKT